MDNENEIKVHYNWVDDECAGIICPYCKEDIVIDIYGYTCKCGKEFKLHQRVWVTEIERK